MPIDFADAIRQERAKRNTQQFDFASALRDGEAPERHDKLDQIGLGEPLLRGHMALGDTVAEKQTIFQRKHPFGDLKRNASGELLYRMNPDEAFRPVEGAPLSKEILADIAEASGQLPELAGEIGGIVASRGMGAIGRMLLPAVGGMTGEALQQGGQELTGVQREPVSDQITRIAGVGATGLLGAGVGELGAMGMNRIRGAGAMRIAPEAVEAQKFAREEGLEPLTPGQAGDVGVIRTLEQQTAATLPSVARRYKQQQRKFTALFKSNFADDAAAQRFVRDTAQVFDQESRLYRQQIKNAVRNRGGTLTEAGRAIQRGRQTWWEQTSRKHVDQLYTAARSFDDPRFDISPLNDALSQIERGTLTLGREGAKVNVERGTVPQEVQEIISDIRSIDPRAFSMSSEERAALGVDDPMEVLKALRSRAWSLTQAGRYGERDQSGVFVARRLYSAITDVMRNPTNQSPRFRQAWAKADRAASERFRIAEMSIMGRIAASDEPAKLARALAQPYEVDNIKMLRHILPRDDWAQFLGAAKDHVISQGIPDALDRFDEPTLKALFNDFELMEMRRAGNAFKRLESAGISETLENRGPTRQTINAMLGNPQQVEQLWDAVRRRGGPTSRYGRIVRSAVLDNIYARSSGTTKEGIEVISADGLMSAFKRAESEGLTRFLTNDDIVALRKYVTYKSFVGRGGDVGASIHAASFGREIADLPVDLLQGRGQAAMNTLETLIQNIGIGRVIAGTGRAPNFIRSLLLGEGVPKSHHAIIRGLGQTAVQLSADAEDERKIGESLVESVRRATSK